MSSPAASPKSESWLLRLRQRLPRWGLALSERKVLLVGGDALITFAAAMIALWLWTFTSGDTFNRAYLFDRRLFWLTAPPAVWLLLNTHLYDLRRAAEFGETVAALSRAAAAAFGFYLLIYFFLPRGLLPRLFILYFLALAALLQGLWRGVYVALLTGPPFSRRALVVSTGWAGEALMQVLTEHGPGPYEVAGQVGAETVEGRTLPDGAASAAGGASLLEMARTQGATEIILAATGEIPGALFQALLDCQAAGIQVTPLPGLYEQLTGRVPIDHIDTDWMVPTFVHRAQRERWEEAFKRLFDIAVALIGLSLLAAQLPVIALAIWLDSGGPIFFRQTRMGRGGALFTMVKFRTMVRGAEGEGQAYWAAPGDPRVTRVGRLLRRTHLDEAPQLWNVLRGEMSFVGPRPERPEFYQQLERQIPFYRARLLVRPGLTGWAQVNYRYGGSVDETAVKLQYDLYYIKHQSLWLDLLITLRTVGVVLMFQGT